MIYLHIEIGYSIFFTHCRNTDFQRFAAIFFLMIYFAQASFGHSIIKLIHQTFNEKSCMEISKMVTFPQLEGVSDIVF